MQEKKQKIKTSAFFDPMGSGYDSIKAEELNKLYPLTVPKPTKYQGDFVANDGAFSAWAWHPDEGKYYKHGASVDPRTGQILKGATHKTFHKEMEYLGDNDYLVVQGDDQKLYTIPKGQKMSDTDLGLAIDSINKNTKGKPVK